MVVVVYGAHSKEFIGCGGVIVGRKDHDIIISWLCGTACGTACGTKP